MLQQINFQYLFIRIINQQNICFLQTTSQFNLPDKIPNNQLKIIADTITKNKNNLQNLKTIYISLESTISLNFAEWKTLLKLLAPLTKNIKEYNVEIHGEVPIKLFSLWKKYKVNRLVWRIFSFNEKIITLNNCHHYTNYFNLILFARKIGFSNQAIDLAYNLKEQTLDDIIKDLKNIQQLKINHLSYYCQINGTNALSIDYETLQQKIFQINYQIYEKNNFVLKKQDQSYHQNSYWFLKNYYAIGVATTSFIKHKSNYLLYENQYQNLNNNPVVINLTAQEYYQLLLINGLTSVKGIHLKNKDNYAAYQTYQSNIDKLIKNQELLIKNNYLFCPINHFKILDFILQKIFL